MIGSRYVPGGADRELAAQATHPEPLREYATSAPSPSVGAHDCTSGYRCWRRTALASLPLDQFFSDGYSFLVEMLFVAHRHGCHIAEVPITFVERREGESKLSRAS